MINIKFWLQSPKELRRLAKILDEIEKELENDQEYFNESVRFLKDDYQIIFWFQYGELESIDITKKGL